MLRVYAKDLSIYTYEQWRRAENVPEKSVRKSFAIPQESFMFENLVRDAV